MIDVQIANEAGFRPDLQPRWIEAIRYVLARHGVSDAEISLAVVDDPTIHALNRRFLAHDEPTDVISFVLERGPAGLEGEIVVSADTARRQAEAYGWPAEDELLLYVVHGALHLVGFDDTTSEAAAKMRHEEQQCLARWGLKPPGRMACAEDKARGGADA